MLIKELLAILRRWRCNVLDMRTQFFTPQLWLMEGDHHLNRSSFLVGKTPEWLLIEWFSSTLQKDSKESYKPKRWGHGHNFWTTLGVPKIVVQTFELIARPVLAWLILFFEYERHPHPPQRFHIWTVLPTAVPDLGCSSPADPSWLCKVTVTSSNSEFWLLKVQSSAVPDLSCSSPVVPSE